MKIDGVGHSEIQVVIRFDEALVTLQELKLLLLRVTLLLFGELVVKVSLQEGDALLEAHWLLPHALHMGVLVHKVHADFLEHLVLLVTVLAIVEHKVVKEVELAVQVLDAVGFAHLLLQVLAEVLIKLIAEGGRPVVALEERVLLGKVEQLRELFDGFLHQDFRLPI